jgi:hypothetical protein
MSTSYIIPFWTVFSIILVVMSVLIWMAVEKSRQNTSISTGTIGIEFLMHHYLVRCLDKTCFIMLQYNGYQAKKGMDIRRTMIRESWVETCAPVLSKIVTHFARGIAVAHDIVDDLKTPIEKSNVFLLPDVVISSTKTEFYRDLLTHTSFIVTGETTSPFESYTNDKCKQYLLTLFASVDEKKTTDSFDGKIIYDVE